MNVSKNAARILFSGLVVLACGLVLVPGKQPAQGEGPGGVQKENLDLPYNAVLDHGEEEDAPELIVFYGEAYEADSFFFCLDRSLSMGDGEWQTLQQELIRNIRELSAQVQFGLTFFARETLVFPETKKPATATDASKGAATALVQGLEPETWTCLMDGLRSTLQMANEATVPRRAIILMSDGKPACPGSDFVTYRAQILGEAVRLNPKRIPIHTVGVGANVDESFLRTLANQSGGSYRRITR